MSDIVFVLQFWRNVTTKKNTKSSKNEAPEAYFHNILAWKNAGIFCQPILLSWRNLKIPLKKVAIELNQEIKNKKKLSRKILKKNDKIEIVHFIGGG